MTEEEGNAAVKELMESIRQRHPTLAHLAGVWRTAWGDRPADAFMQGVIMGYKSAWDDEATGVWKEWKAQQEAKR